jgi:hypothetical protein
MVGGGREGKRKKGHKLNPFLKLKKKKQIMLQPNSNKSTYKNKENKLNGF